MPVSIQQKSGNASKNYRFYTVSEIDSFLTNKLRYNERATVIGGSGGQGGPGDILDSELQADLDQLDQELTTLDGNLTDLDNILGNPPDSATFFESIVTNQAWIDELVANQAWLDNLFVNNAYADRITANEINVSELNAVSANTGDLTVNGTLTLSTGGVITNTNDEFRLGEDGLSFSDGTLSSQRLQWKESTFSSIRSEIYHNNHMIIDTENQFELRIDNTEEYNFDNDRLDLNLGTNKVLKLPHLTDGERDAFSAEEGDFIYNTTANGLQFYDGTNWVGS